MIMFKGPKVILLGSRRNLDAWSPSADSFCKKHAVLNYFPWTWMLSDLIRARTWVYGCIITLLLTQRLLGTLWWLGEYHVYVLNVWRGSKNLSPSATPIRAMTVSIGVCTLDGMIGWRSISERRETVTLMIYWVRNSWHWIRLAKEWQNILWAANMERTWWMTQWNTTLFSGRRIHGKSRMDLWKLMEV